MADFSVLAFQKSAPPRWVQPGVLVSGWIYIGIDPLFYLEELKEQFSQAGCALDGGRV
jgi:hypothetical protein